MAPSIGKLEGTAEEVWGTLPYDPEKHIQEPVCFFGIYGFPDFYSLWRHKGKRAILFAGSDIIHFNNGYWLDNEGKIRIEPKQMAEWINNNCESWVENEVEYDLLKRMGIESSISPSFMGNVDDYKVTYKWSEQPKVYASVSGDDFTLYEWKLIDKLAFNNPGIEFHLYGNSSKWASNNKNIFVRGRVPKEQMNEEIKHMQGGLRPLGFEGFSEIVAKSILWGQWPISRIDYPYMLRVEDIKTLKDKKEPNIEGRDYFLKTLNKFPWNANTHN